MSATSDNHCLNCEVSYELHHLPVILLHQKQTGIHTMSPSHSIRPDHVVFYHGSSTSCGITDMICPPVDTNVVSEKGRNKNLDRVFLHLI